jgi:hypothetical protein
MFVNSLVFEVPTGSGTKFVDPLRVYRRLTHALGQDPTATLTQARSPDPSVAFQAQEELYRAARFAFELPFDPATGQGATEEVLNAALRSYRDYVEKKKDDYRELADFIAAYHVLPFDLSYDDFVGLWFNKDRVRLQNSIDVARGIGITKTNDDLSVDWFDAITSYVPLIVDLQFETNADRMEARTIRGPHRS